jgi:hypothetical protein
VGAVGGLRERGGELGDLGSGQLAGAGVGVEHGGETVGRRRELVPAIEYASTHTTYVLKPDPATEESSHGDLVGGVQDRTRVPSSADTSVSELEGRIALRIGRRERQLREEGQVEAP